ncbi:S41 family peptidase [Lysobacter sp. D1-1-M9]|uniref:S41 family peptidase n=1 Tax=Novilysobacter longmucuonensis TaxID=3098603 RepID=UPI002FCBC373
MRFVHVFLAVLLAAAAGGCQSSHGTAPADDPTASYTPEQLREDLDHLEQAVAQRHPRFHDRVPDAALTRAFGEAREALDVPMSRAEAFRVLAQVNPAFADAHTLLMPTFALEALASGGGFPLNIRIRHDGALVVAGNWQRENGAERLAEGILIRSINGETTDALLEDLSRYGHGETAALRQHMLAALFPHWLAAIRGWTDDFRLEVEQDGVLRQLQIVAGDQWAEVDAAAMPDRPTLRDLGDGIALMRLPTFDVDDDPDAYRTAVESLFGALRQGGATGLVLDVRGNTGGQSDAGAQVIRYLIDRPVNQVSRARERLNEANRGILGYKGKVGQMREMDLSRDGLIKPARATERFDGEVVVLIDAMTYSAGILFATTLQDHQLATVIGQPTGGHANQTGNMEQVHLPNTGLMAYIPARIFVRPNGESGTSPVIPDLIVKPAVGDGDPFLGAAVKYLSAR